MIKDLFIGISYLIGLFIKLIAFLLKGILNFIRYCFTDMNKIYSESYNDYKKLGIFRKGSIKGGDEIL